MANGLDCNIPMLEVNYNYLNASVMLTRGNIYSIWKVIGRKIDADGDAIGKTNNNPIIDTCEYRVGFYYGEAS